MTRGRGDCKGDDRKAGEHAGIRGLHVMAMYREEAIRGPVEGAGDDGPARGETVFSGV